MWIFTILGFILLFRILTRGKPTLIEVDMDCPTVIDGAIATNSEEFGHDPLLIRAVIKIESSFDPKAKGGAGEIGLMQISEICLKHFNQVTSLNYSLWDLHDIHMNVHIGCWYLRWLKDQLREEKSSELLEQVLRSYNCGMGNRHKKACGEYYAKVIKEYDRLIETKRS